MELGIYYHQPWKGFVAFCWDNMDEAVSILEEKIKRELIDFVGAFQIRHVGDIGDHDFAGAGD